MYSNFIKLIMCLDYIRICIFFLLFNSRCYCQGHVLFLMLCSWLVFYMCIYVFKYHVNVRVIIILTYVLTMLMFVFWIFIYILLLLIYLVYWTYRKYRKEKVHCKWNLLFHFVSWYELINFCNCVLTFMLDLSCSFFK